MNIYERIKQDHDRQRELAAKIMKTSGDSEERRRLWAEFKTEAESHANAEEQTLYAELIAISNTQEKARHSVHEHEEAADLIEELTKLDMGSGGWLHKFEKLKDELEHHMREEEDEVFPQAKKIIKGEQAERLVAVFDRRKSAEAADIETA